MVFGYVCVFVLISMLNGNKRELKNVLEACQFIEEYCGMCITLHIYTFNFRTLHLYRLLVA